MQVDETQAHVVEGFVRQHQHGPVEPQLRQVLPAGMGVQFRGVDPGRLHLLDEALIGVPAVDAPADLEVAERGADLDLAPIASAAVLLVVLLPGDALLGQRRRRVAVVEVALAVDEVHEFLDGYAHR